jgi:hypothetical protein
LRIVDCGLRIEEEALAWIGDGSSRQPYTPTSCGSAREHGAVGQDGAQDNILRLPGRAEPPLCPKILGGAAAPPYQGHEEFCPAPGVMKIPPPTAWFHRCEKVVNKM